MKIYVGNLSPNVEDEDLRVIFAEYGEVTSAKVIKDNKSGLSRGFGFVVMPNDKAAKTAISELHRAEYDYKEISVNEARPKTKPKK